MSYSIPNFYTNFKNELHCEFVWFPKHYHFCYRVAQKLLHPLFQFRMTQPDRYDIAFLRLLTPITYTSHILPICLPDNEIKLWGKSGVIAGWGKTDASMGHTGTNILRSATVPILSKYLMSTLSMLGKIWRRCSTFYESDKLYCLLCLVVFKNSSGA